MPAKVYINGRFLTQKTTGVQRFAQEVVREIDRLVSEGHESTLSLDFEVLAPQGALSELELADIEVHQVGCTQGHVWEQLELPSITRTSHLLSLANTGPLTKADQTVVIHDAAVFAMPTTFSGAFRRWYKVLLPGLGRRARAIATVSEFSREELMRYCNIPPEKLHVIPEGFEHMMRQAPDREILKRHGLDERPFVLAVSSLNPSKNFNALVEALTHLESADFSVVIAGGVNPSVFNPSLTEGATPVRYLGYVSDAELKALYEQASCFVHPSLYEGFGLTPLEAMACGAPVAVADIPAIREVCGDAAVYFDPKNPADIASKIELIMESSHVREDLGRKAENRLREFGWRQSALSLLEVVTSSAMPRAGAA